MPSGESLAQAVSKQAKGDGLRMGRLRVSFSVVNRWLAPQGQNGAQGTCSFPFMVSREVGMTPALPVPQTALVVQAIKKDQEGDAVAALSLYCKALDFFVPALRCKCPESLCAAGWVSHRCTGWIPEAAPIQNLVGDQNLVLWGIPEGLVWGKGSPASGSSY